MALTRLNNRALASDSQFTADQLDVGQLGGRRNLIINGDMKVSQRGDYTSGVVGYSGGYYLDRWYSARDVVNATLQHTSTSPSGYGKSLKITATSSTTGEISSFQKLEGTTVDFIKGKTVTLSAWVRSNTSSARLMAYSGVAWVSLPDAAHTGGGDWEFLTTTFTVPTNAVEQFRPYVAIRNSNSTSTAIATGDYIEFTQVQLELGSVATPFEHRSYGEELALCQRYYQHSNGAGPHPANGANTTSHGVGTGPLGAVVCWGGTASQHTPIPLPVTMRANPSVTKYGNSQGYLSYVQASTAGPNGIIATNFHQHLYIGVENSGLLGLNNQVSGNPLWGTFGGWSADAEL